MRLSIPKTDARYFQLCFQYIFLCYGIIYLHWNDYLNYVLYFSTCILCQFLFDYLKNYFSKQTFTAAHLTNGLKSAAITAFGLSLLLKTNHWEIAILAAFISIASKYIFTFRKKHLFNPSAAGIVATILLTDKAWISPGQWGSEIVLFFLILSLGFIVVTRVQKVDISLAFLVTFLALVYWRQIIYQGWPLDHFIQSMSTGSLLLFSFFMISDPRTTPNHSAARIIFAVLIAALSFYFTAFKFVNGAAVWVLVFASPLVPLLDALFKSKRFQWTAEKQHASHAAQPKALPG